MHFLSSLLKYSSQIMVHLLPEGLKVLSWPSALSVSYRAELSGLVGLSLYTDSVTSFSASEKPP